MDINVVDSVLTELFNTSGFLQDDELYLYDVEDSEFKKSDQAERVIKEVERRKFENAVKAAKEGVIRTATDARAKLTNNSDPYKVAGWNGKAQRAQRVLANAASDADISILQAECDKRGKSETPQELAHKQAAKSESLATAVAIIDGMESAALKAIESKRSENALTKLLEDLQVQADQQLKQLMGT